MAEMKNSGDSESEEVKCVTKEYRNLLHEAMLINEDDKPGRGNIQNISSLMWKADHLIRDVQNPNNTIGLLDAKVISIGTNVLKRTAEAVDANLFSFTAEEYCDNIISYLKQEPCGTNNIRLMSQKLAPIAAKCFSRTPSYMYMLGTFQVGEVAVTQKKARKQKEKQEEGSTKQPENVKRLEKQEDGVEETVHYIMNVVTAAYRQNKNKPINYFKLVINPDSFGATIENIFHVSFLVKDGYVDLSLDQNRIPVIAPARRDVVENRKKYDQTRQQMFLEIDMHQWEELKKTCAIRRAMLNPRNVTAAQASHH